MKKSKQVWVGAFLAVLCLSFVAARYEDFTVGVLTVEKAATFESTLNVPAGSLQLSGVAVTATAAELNAVADPAVGASANATNTQVVTLDFTKAIMQINSRGGTNTAVNTITLANAATADIGKSVVVVNVGTTNSLAIAKTGTYYGPAISLATGESVVLYSTAANKWYSHGNQ